MSGDFGRRRSPVCVLEGQQPLLVLHDSLTACQPACWTAARRNFDWDALAARKTKPPYVPKVGGWVGGAPWQWGALAVGRPGSGAHSPRACFPARQGHAG